MTPRSIEVFADTASIDEVRKYAADPRVAGFTTNPTLFRAAGAANYVDHARALLDAAAGKPVSLEVTGDDDLTICRQAFRLAGLGPQVVIKVPVTDTRGVLMKKTIVSLLGARLAVNVTAVFTVQQVIDIARECADASGPLIVSVFAGRVADAGVEPWSHLLACKQIARAHCPRARVLWASPRQAYDLVLAERAGCDIITMTPALIEKTKLFGKDLDQFSVETVQMFYNDAQAAGYEF